ncbi:MAG: hypothetical protein R3F10_04695 [Lysobacteraceae bacterium]
MFRLALASILLLSAPQVAAQTVAHQDANGASTNCPDAIESSAVADPAPAANGNVSVQTASPKPGSGGTLGETSRSAAPRQAAPRVRWHSFLPGMMK